MSLKWCDVKLIISDFDGVMTDNRVLVDETGKESVYVSRADGQGINMLRSLGIELTIISTEINEVVQKRADKLKVECIHGVKDKAECMKRYCIGKGISLSSVVYIGNDINDYAAMLLAGIKIAPQDAYGEVKSIADYVTKAEGGHGVIREIAGIIKQNKESD